MTEIDEYEAMQEDEPAEETSESPDENSQTEELLPMLHYMSSVLDQLKEAATVLQEEREKLQTYGSSLKEITAVLSAEADHLQEAQTATLQNVDRGCRDMFALTKYRTDPFPLKQFGREEAATVIEQAEKWQKKLLYKQTNRFEMIGMVAYIIPILVVLDILVHVYFR